MVRHILVAVAWPYANGLSHIGHIAGAYLPADIFARYHRLRGHRVLMVSGSDAHGTPITVKADQEGVSPADIVARYHPRFLEQWERLGISFDLFTSTMTDNHREVVWDVFRRLRERGYIEPRTTEQFYDPVAGRFLPDRYVEGTCPRCRYPEARGDQCEQCGATLDPTDLIEPRSKLTGATPELRPTDHYFVLLTKLEDPVRRWLETRTGWRPHVINWALGFLREGLQDRAITRDLDWGVPLPPEADTLGPGKRIYVWFEAVIGYLSASKEWAAKVGDADAWRAWWEDPAAETYYFVGKDNIPFHAVFWPAYLIGYGGLNLPTDVPANNYVTFKGAKASKSRGLGTPVLELLEDYEPDALRYAVATILPETNDTDFSEEEMVRRINDELVATWGNLVHRVVTMVHRTNSGRVPEPGPLDARDRELLATVDTVLEQEAAHIERVELRAGLRKAMEGAAAINAYLNAREPWRTARTDPVRTATTLKVALDAIAGIKVGLAPYLPATCAALDRMLGGDGHIGAWERVPVPVGTALPRAEPLYRKVEEPAA